MGLATGSMFLHPLSAFLAPTTVTWDASSCPTGIYTITALARGVGNSKSDSVTTSNVSLPKASIAQQFQNLPAGTYKVSAVAIPASGTTYGSEFVTLTASGSDSGVVFGRSRPASNPAIGLARSRNQPPNPTLPPKDPKRLTPAGSTNVPAEGSTMPRAEGVREPLARQLLALLADSTEADRQWRRVDAIDEDGDGVFDYVAVESISGEIWIYRFHGS